MTTSAGLVRPKSRSALAAATASPWTNAIAVGPCEQLGELGEPGLFRGPAGQRVLEDLVLGGRRPQRAAQGRQLGDGEAAVLGEDRGVGVAELGADLVDDGDLLGSRHVCSGN